METKSTELARLYRPVDQSFFPAPNIIATYDKEKNLVYFDREAYESLGPKVQRMILSLDTTYLEIDFN